VSKTTEICSRCGFEKCSGCSSGCVNTGFASWSACENDKRAEREVWLAKTSVDGHSLLAWEDIYQVVKNGSGHRHFVYARSAELGYTIMRSLPNGKIRAVPTSRLHPKKKS